ncbi:MAG: hypothetical protein HFJ59_02430 [Clostridia bacterium]|nr:hypothetical protein [Clostridia bacterium]
MRDFQGFNPHKIRTNMSSNEKEDIKWYDENEEKENYINFRSQDIEDLDEER